MVKLVTVRRARLYGPPSYRDSFEMANAIIYFGAAILLLVGVSFGLPHLNNTLGLIFVLLALLLLVAINLHDLHAQLAGIQFDTEILRLDKQLAFVEIAAPLVYATGSVILFVGVLFLLRISPGKHSFWLSKRRRLNVHSMRLLFVGSLVWLFGSILNSFQVYERTPLQLQAYQKSVLVCFLLSSTLLVFSTSLGLSTFPAEAAGQIQCITVCFSIVACALLVLAAILNIIRILQMWQYEHNGILLEPLRGGVVTGTETAPLIPPAPAESVGVQPERLY